MLESYWSIAALVAVMLYFHIVIGELEVSSSPSVQNTILVYSYVLIGGLYTYNNTRGKD